MSVAENNNNNMCTVNVHDGRYLIKSPNGDPIPKVLDINVNQGVDLSQSGFVEVTITLHCKLSNTE